VTLAAPARLAATAVSAPIVPPAGDQHAPAGHLGTINGMHGD